MARWRPLPGELPPQARRLAEELRLHKDRSRLSLNSLAAKTAYSSSSWHRYLNGRALPPWDAVDALGRLARADRGLLRVLWESASDAWTAEQRPKETEDPKAAEEPEAEEAAEAAHRGAGSAAGRTWLPGRLRRLSRRTVVGAAVAGCGLLAVLLLLLLVRLGSGDTRPRSAPPGAPEGSPAWPWDLRASRSASADGGCAGRSCQGRDPYREGCDRDSVTVHALSADGRTLRLRYSPVCRTVWAEVDPA
ncbi:helix-turn-helix domain-containing protein, partial [Streptomyces sp. 2MCAF27]